MTFWLEDGSSINLVVGGILYQEGIVDETISCIIDYQVIEKSLFNAKFDSVYSQSKVENAILNTLAYYHSFPSYNIQLGAALLLGIISLLLAIVALFNTFAVIMSVRSKEFNGLKLIGAKKKQIFKMTILETLTVTITGVIIGLVILILGVGLYSKADIGIFDFIVNKQIFFGTLGLTILLAFIAGTLPSLVTLNKLKQQSRVE